MQTLSMLDKKNHAEEQQNPSEQAQPESNYDATRDVIWRHINNKDDVITDDDLKNAYTGKPVELPEEDEELTRSRQKDLDDSRSEDKERDKDHDGFDDRDEGYVPPSNIIGE
jgi:hypothetical protein